MSDINQLRERLNHLTPEQLEKIGGADCSVQDYIIAIDQLQSSYDTLVDFTSYVIERVVGP
jgi:hypothetical protein